MEPGRRPLDPQCSNSSASFASFFLEQAAQTDQSLGQSHLGKSGLFCGKPPLSTAPHPLDPCTPAMSGAAPPVLLLRKSSQANMDAPQAGGLHVSPRTLYPCRRTGPRRAPRLDAKEKGRASLPRGRHAIGGGARRVAPPGATLCNAQGTSRQGQGRVPTRPAAQTSRTAITTRNRQGRRKGCHEEGQGRSRKNLWHAIIHCPGQTRSRQDQNGRLEEHTAGYSLILQGSSGSRALKSGVGVDPFP
jgi:hypothetical protein